MFSRKDQGLLSTRNPQELNANALRYHTSITRLQLSSALLSVMSANRPPGDYFTTAKTGLRLLQWSEAFSRHGNREKMLTRYGIVLQSLAHSSALLSVVFANGPPGDYFTTTKMGLCLLEKSKAFSRHGSREKMCQQGMVSCLPADIISTCASSLYALYRTTL